ncbi:hypothetical protein RvY_08591 [Ramazzottius varieornatus]|uniref:Uncharacterized protein n=1 Tax=Ramazzottius varieornatus TaxID=947166 RepID=A0A1D1V906_RAMVA|nr:hypothetical protein RvY_08591 [Ramazzottius varieornatus]
MFFFAVGWAVFGRGSRRTISSRLRCQRTDHLQSDSRKAASSFHLEVRLKVYNSTNNTKWHLVDTIQIVIWADVAPHEAEVLREYIKENALFYFKHSVDDSATGKLRTLEYDRSTKKRAARQKLRMSAAEMSDDGDKAEIFWPTSGMVYLKLQCGLPVLTLLPWKNVELGRQEPENVFGKPCLFGPVVGKAVKGPAQHLSQVGTYTYDATGDFELEGKNQPWTDSKALAYGLTFECDLSV